MKNHLFLIALLIHLVAFSQNKKVIENAYPNMIGDIEYDEKIDNPNFVLCDSNNIHQYFNDSKGFEFEGEKIALEKIFFEKYQSKNIESESGLIRIRFVVNCYGETSRFRLTSMDENYIQKKFEESITNQLVEITKELKGWKPKIYRGSKTDYYQYLIFKIDNGQLKEILP
jgi:hypothetical protein